MVYSQNFRQALSLLSRAKHVRSWLAISLLATYVGIYTYISLIRINEKWNVIIRVKLFHVLLHEIARLFLSSMVLLCHFIK